MAKQVHDSSHTYWALEAIRSYLYLQFLAHVSRVRVKRESIHMSQFFFLLYSKCDSTLSSQESCPAKSWPSASSSTLTRFTTLPPSANVIASMISAFVNTKQAGRSIILVSWRYHESRLHERKAQETSQYVKWNVSSQTCLASCPLCVLAHVPGRG